MGAALAGTQARGRLNDKEFRPLRRATRGAAPRPRKLLKKFDQNFYYEKLLILSLYEDPYQRREKYSYPVPAQIVNRSRRRGQIVNRRRLPAALPQSAPHGRAWKAAAA